VKKEQLLGNLISGSLSDGLMMRIRAGTQLETIKTGKFVSIKGDLFTYFSLVCDITLSVTNPEILLFPPDESETVLRSLIAQKHTYATALLKPMIMLGPDKRPMPVKTIPTHFTAVYESSNQEISQIFGSETEEPKKYFNVGSPIDMAAPVCLNLEKITERSNGIFGKTGTGKTFLTRLLLAGLIKSDKAVSLIFDMHSEYALQARKEGDHGSFVKGLKTLFGNKVALFSLDPASTRRRGATPDVEISIPLQVITVEDILSLQDELNLHSTALEAAYLLATRYKQDWLDALLQTDNLKEFAHELGAHPESIAALYRKLKRLERFPFFKRTTGVKDPSVIDIMMEYIDKGISIIIEFGNYTSTLSYLLLANIITRRIHAEYIAKTEKFLSSQKKEDEPKRLLITIEEAHKFLNTHAAKQTIFGTIAREMRKYYVSLLVVDQRPSGIDEEILSQIGTKIIAQLNDEKDIQAVLTGTAHANSLRSVLAGLDSKKQALILGHAVTMPVVIQTREYNEQFYQEMAPRIEKKDIDQFINELF
jgi:hypothetical protein